MADEVSEAQLLAISTRLNDRFKTLHGRIIDHRLHFYADPEVDPKLGKWVGNQPDPDNPYQDVSKYQSDAPRRLTQRLVARLSENPIVVDVEPPTEGLRTAANDLAIILNAWMADIAERTDTNIQQAAGYYQARDCYAVLHSRLATDMWAPMERKYRDEPGEGYEPDADDDGAEAAQDGADGAKRARRYREKAGEYMARQERARAKEGAPWYWELVDPLSFAYERDRSGRRGLARALVKYEVSADVYEEAQRSKRGDGELSPTELTSLSPAPGVENDTDGNANHSTPSSADFEDRTTVYQYWDRDYWCEYVEGKGGLRKVKGGPNPFGQVPFWIVWANRTFHPDPAWDAEPYMEGVYRQKPYWDRIVTLTAAITELNAEPLLMKRRRDWAASPVLPSGAPEGMTGPSAADTEIEPGVDVQQIQVTLDPGLANTLALIREEMRESEPPTGTVELGASTAPWTARIMQTEANVGPKVLMDNLVTAVKAMVGMWLGWHAANPAEAMVAYQRGGDGKRRRSNVVRVDPSETDLNEFDPEVSINPISGAEQITVMQLMRELVTPTERMGALITLTEFYEKGMNKEDPDDYARQVLIENIARPFQEQYVKTKVATVMGSRFMLGVDGEIINRGTGQAVQPGDVLQQNGWTPAPQPQVGGEAVPPGAVQMPEMGTMAAPGTVAIGGLV